MYGVQWWIQDLQKGEAYNNGFVINISKTSKWEVVKTTKLVLLQNDLFFFFFGLHGIFLILRAFPVQIIIKHTFSSIFWPPISLFHLFLNSTPTSNQKGGGGGTLSMPIHFPIGTHPHLAKKGGGGYVPEMPPP